MRKAHKLKNKMTAILILIAIYLISCRGSYLFIQKAHYHKDGRWTNLKPNSGDTTITFIPVANSFMAIDYLFGGWKRYRSTDFFKPKQTHENN